MLLVLVATKRAVFCWQCFSDLGLALIVYLRCLRQCRQFGWHCMVPFDRLGQSAHFAVLWRFIIMFLILVCWQPESMWSALSVQGQMEQFALGEKPCIWLKIVPVRYLITLRFSILFLSVLWHDSYFISWTGSLILKMYDSLLIYGACLLHNVAVAVFTNWKG